MDFLESAYRGTVETDSVLEEVRAHLRERDGKVLPEAGQIGELEIDDLDVVALDHLQDIARVLRPLRAEAPRFDLNHR